MDTTVFKKPNQGGYLLQQRNKEAFDRNTNGKTPNFIESSETTTPSLDTGNATLPPTGTCCMYTETISNNYGNCAFVSFNLTNIFQISNISFNYNRFSAVISKVMGKLRTEPLLSYNTWRT